MPCPAAGDAAPKTLPGSSDAVACHCTAPLAAWEWRAGEQIQWSLGVLGAFAYVSLFPSLISYFIYNWATHEVGAASAGQAITLMPLFGALLSALLLGEVLYPYHWLGMALILTFFPEAGGMLLIAAFWGCWQLLTGLGLALFWSRRAPLPKLAAAGGRTP